MKEVIRYGYDTQQIKSLIFPLLAKSNIDITDIVLTDYVYSFWVNKTKWSFSCRDNGIVLCIGDPIMRFDFVCLDDMTKFVSDKILVDSIL